MEELNVNFYSNPDYLQSLSLFFIRLTLFYRTIDNEKTSIKIGALEAWLTKDRDKINQFRTILHKGEWVTKPMLTL